jgi:tetratricopeptide (TPR) repeat protein
MKKIRQKNTWKTANSIESALRHQQSGNLTEAELLYRKILREKPNNSSACFGLAFVLGAKGHKDEAIKYYRKALKINPQFADAAFNLAGVYQEMCQFNEAIHYYEMSIRLNPEFASAHSNLGSILQQQGRFEEAIDLYQKALEFNPNLISAYNNMGLAFQEKGLYDKAMECYKTALSFDSRHPAVHFNTGVLLLLHGDYEKGWPEYEWRKQMTGYQSRYFNQPMWDGSGLSGKRLLLYNEKGYEGFGDTIQFIRYAGRLAESGARIIVECRQELKSLLMTAEGIEDVIAEGDRMPYFDLHCPFLSLPLILETKLEDIPSYVPYLKTDFSTLKKWEERLRHDDSSFKVGIAWAGDPGHPRYQYRSCSLGQFAPFAQVQGISVYSLQKGTAAIEEKPPAGLNFFDCREDIVDFLDTAALIENLDLVISVDTAVAHLAGALGKPVWTLLPFVPDWRWLLNRDDSPWYPTMRLFRQPSAGDWDSAISHIAAELKKTIV